MKYSFGGIFPVAGFLRGNIPADGYPKEEIPSIFVHENQLSTPVLIGHGLNDDVVSIKTSEIAYDALKQRGCNVSFFK